MIFDIKTYTNIGKRTENQDSLRCEVFDDILISCIADGVGGRLGGQIASSEAVNSFVNEIPYTTKIEDINLKVVLNKIHNEMIVRKDDGLSGMATTFTGVIIKELKLMGIHVGDTRLCILRGNGIKQLTINHTEIARLVREGLIDVKEAKKYPRRNVIENAIGIKDRELTTFNFEFQLEKYDRILLTTDGVHETVSKMEFRDISISSKTSEDFLCQVTKLLDIREPKDNCSMIIITI